MPTIATVPCGDMVVRYEQDDATGDVRFMLSPAAAAPSFAPEVGALGPLGGDEGEEQATEPGAVPEVGFPHESLVQVSLMGDTAGGERSQGRTLRNSSTTKELQLVGHRVAESGGAIAVTVDLVAEGILAASHNLRWQPGDDAVAVDTSVTNISDSPVTLQLLASFCLAGIGGPARDDPPGRFLVHRIRTGWSSEGRLVSEPFEDLHLERAWSDHAVNVERFGQVGSMPVRGFAPCAGLADTLAGVTWAAQLAWAGSWQMELFGRGSKVSLSGGLADSDFGHWRKTLAPGESFTTPAPG